MDTPLWSWDIAWAHTANLLSVTGGHVTLLSDKFDYVNLITQEPVRGDAHYFEFKIHRIGDEQWCGVTSSKQRCGFDSGEKERGWFYYCCRRCSDSGRLQGPHQGRDVQKFEHIADGDVIGMLLDADQGRLAFLRNGRFQGACMVDRGPLYPTTCLHSEGDCVELQKLRLNQSPMTLDELRALPLDSDTLVMPKGVKLSSLAGELLVEVPPAEPPSWTILGFKRHVQQEIGVPVALQQILLNEKILSDDETLGNDDFTLIIDETPLWSWDTSWVHQAGLLSANGGHVTFLSDEFDYVNLITQEPMRGDAHYFEFKMHRVGDEQWCGVTSSEDRCGIESGESERGWYYYCGRRWSESGRLQAPHEGTNVQTFEHISNGDVIGMLVDADQGRLAFMRNGRFQGACMVDRGPLYPTTCLDSGSDCVELQRLPLNESPMTLDELRALPLDAATSAAASTVSTPSSIAESEW